MIKKSAFRLALSAFIFLPALLGCSALGIRNGESHSSSASFRERVLLPEIERFEEGRGKDPFQSQTPVPNRPITLEEAIAIALANNPSVKVSSEDVAIAGGNVDVARSLFFPQVSGGYGLVRSERQPAFVDPNNPLMPPFYAGEKAFKRAEVKVQMILWDFGRTLGTYRQSVLAKEIAELQSKRNGQMVRLQVAEAYFNVLRAKRARSIVEESLAQAKAHLKTAKSFYDAELVDKNDVLRAELQVAELEQALIKTKNAIEMATSVFNMTLGISVNRKTEVADVEETSAIAVSLGNALRLAVDNRPEFKVVQKAIKIQEEALNVAWAGHMPRIYVGGQYDWSDDAYRKWGGSDLHKGAWTGEIGIQINLFTGGRTTAQTRIAKSKIRQAEERAKQLCDAIALQVKSGVLGIGEAKERIAVAKKAIVQARENLRLMNNKYKEKIASSTDVVDAEAILSRSQSNYYSAVYDYHTAIARLVGAAGTEKLGSYIPRGEEAEKPEGKKQ
jgi:outer membrane protein TolC